MTKELNRSYSFVLSEIFIGRNICGELTFKKLITAYKMNGNTQLGPGV